MPPSLPPGSIQDYGISDLPSLPRTVAWIMVSLTSSPPPLPALPRRGGGRRVAVGPSEVFPFGTSSYGTLLRGGDPYGRVFLV